MTREKAKELMVIIHPKLTVIINKYKLSGVGTGQRCEGNYVYGIVYLTKFVDGDDQANFISSPNNSYLLYWWHKLSVE